MSTPTYLPTPPRLKRAGRPRKDAERSCLSVAERNRISSKNSRLRRAIHKTRFRRVVNELVSNLPAPADAYKLGLKEAQDLVAATALKLSNLVDDMEQEKDSRLVRELDNLAFLDDMLRTNTEYQDASGDLPSPIPDLPSLPDLP